MSVKAKMSEEHFAIVIKDKKKLDNEAKFKHIFINQFLTKAERERDTNLRILKGELIKSADTEGNVEYGGEKFNLNKGSFKVVNLELKFFSKPAHS